MRKWLCFFLLFSIIASAQNILSSLKSSEILAKARSNYGESGHSRIKQWLDFIDATENKNEWQKINLVNDFFNEKVIYRTDELLWNKKDYWASPIETLGVGMGDCEDYVIAKYFTLVALGVPEDKIRLMYVRQQTVNQPHMVLIYLERSNEPPMVLDNFETRLLPANARRDLTPIYSFNGKGLWLAKAKGLGNKIKDSNGVSAWDTMLERIEQGELALPAQNKGTISYAQTF